jgi:hypothetical protein
MGAVGISLDPPERQTDSFTMVSYLLYENMICTLLTVPMFRSAEAVCDFVSCEPEQPPKRRWCSLRFYSRALIGSCNARSEVISWAVVILPPLFLSRGMAAYRADVTACALSAKAKHHKHTDNRRIEAYMACFKRSFAAVAYLYVPVHVCHYSGSAVGRSRVLRSGTTVCCR